MKNTSRIDSLQHSLAFTSLSLMAVLSRIMPHPPGMTAFTSFCVLQGMKSTSNKSIILIVLVALLSDLTLKHVMQFSFLGSWILFTYSGYVGLFLLGRYFGNHKQGLSLVSLLSLGALVYWLWTNLGVWMMSGMYTHTTQGFYQCYAAALPFLFSGLLGDVALGCFMSWTQELLLRLFNNPRFYVAASLG